MGFNDHFTSGDRLDLQTVYFKALLNILDSTPKSTDTFAAFAYYYRVGTFIRIAKIALSNEAVDALNKIIEGFTVRWENAKKEADDENEADPLKGPTIPLDTAAITILCANQLLGETMRHLDASGIVRTRKKGAIAAFGEVDLKTGNIHVVLDNEADRDEGNDEDDEMTDDDYPDDGPGDDEE